MDLGEIFLLLGGSRSLILEAFVDPCRLERHYFGSDPFLCCKRDCVVVFKSNTRIRGPHRHLLRFIVLAAFILDAYASNEVDTALLIPNPNLIDFSECHHDELKGVHHEHEEVGGEDTSPKKVDLLLPRRMGIGCNSTKRIGWCSL